MCTLYVLHAARCPLHVACMCCAAVGASEEGSHGSDQRGTRWQRFGHSRGSDRRRLLSRVVGLVLLPHRRVLRGTPSARARTRVWSGRKPELGQRTAAMAAGSREAGTTGSGQRRAAQARCDLRAASANPESDALSSCRPSTPDKTYTADTHTRKHARTHEQKDSLAHTHACAQTHAFKHAYTHGSTPARPPERTHAHFALPHHSRRAHRVATARSHLPVRVL